MGSTLPLPDRWPMLLTDQDGSTAYAWFPPDTPTDPAHVLPGEVYVRLCELVGVDSRATWVAFADRMAALAAMAAACLAATERLPA